MKPRVSMWIESEQYCVVFHNKNRLTNGEKEIPALQGTGTLLLMGSIDQKDKTLTFRCYQNTTNAVSVCKPPQLICSMVVMWNSGI